MDIAQENLKLLASQRPGGMLALLENESAGGNAGRHRLGTVSYACTGANFVHDHGLILYFDNPQFLSHDLREYPSACYKVINGEVDPKHLAALRRGDLDPNDLEGLCAIVSLHGTVDEESKELLLETARRYNHLHGADITPVWERHAY